MTVTSVVGDDLPPAAEVKLFAEAPDVGCDRVGGDAQFTGDFLALTGNERRVYERALDLARPLGLDLDQIAAEAVGPRQRLNGVGSGARPQF